MPHKKTHMKTNQDGGSYTTKKPGAAANELQKNQEGAAKMGYDQKFGADRMSPSKMGDMKASELMHGAAKYYDGAGQYMNGAAKYEGAAKHHGAPDMHKGPMMKGHEGPMMKGYEGPMTGHAEGAMKKKTNDGPMTPGHGGASGHTHDDDSMFKGSSITVGQKVLRPEDFYDKPAADRVRSTLAAESTDPETDAPAPIQIDEYGYSTHPDEGRRRAQNLSLGLREVERRPITAQETKFEEQFGLRKFEGLKPFLDDEPTLEFVKSRRRSEKPAQTYKAYQEGPVAQRYQENVNIAQQQLEKEKGFTMKGRGTTVKSVSSQLQSSADNAMAELKKKAAGLTAAQNLNLDKKPKKPKAPYSLASVAIQALKVPFTTRAFGAREGAKDEVKRKAGLATMKGYKKRIL